MTQYSSNANYSYINSLFTLGRPLKVLVAHFLNLFLSRSAQLGKNLWKDPCFSNKFRELDQICMFSQNFWGTSFHPGNSGHVGTRKIVNSLFSTSTQMLHLWISQHKRKQNRKDFCIIWALPQDLVLPTRLLYFELLILLIKKSFILWYITGIFLVYRSCISVP